MIKEKNQKPIVGVVGLGSVGWAVVHKMREFYECVKYDIYDPAYYIWEDILKSDIIFICISTPPHNNRLDCSGIEETIDRLSTCNYRGLIVIKSTLQVGFMDRVVIKHSTLRLVYMPEFLREDSCFTWFMKPDRLVISGKQADVEEVLRYFDWVENDVPRLSMNYIDAEIGKLAHNAYIAVKVSFTNEIEEICDQHGADAMKVMSVIWADRRVRNQAHLTPYLGGYAGKCIPKDTLELTSAASNPVLLNAAKKRNALAKPMHSKKQEERIGVVIPTMDRSELLNRALNSIKNQQRLPDLVVIVDDSTTAHQIENDGIVMQCTRLFPIVKVHNTHSLNLSGAINAGLDVIKEHGFNPALTFIALLDDDDWWDRMYLANVSKFAEETEADWIIAGLIRHDTTNPRGNPQKIPERVSFKDFLITNPNVQGSNLFVRFSKLIEAGSYDEKMVSTTDRDVCIRLSRIDGIKIQVLRNHLVHHDASDERQRLSTPGNEKKKAGLQYFYQKYQGLMDEEEKQKFKARAKTLFATDIQ
jgi:UDPglucose 6-dehydrogenase